MQLQGISYWNVFYELTLTDRNMQARFYLKVVLKSWGSDIWVSSTSFQKSNIDWPQQPPTEIGPKIQHDISWFYHFFFLSKHQNKAELKNLHGSEVLSSDFPSLKNSAASMASTASTTSMASMTFTASFHQKNYCSWWLDTSWQPNHQYWSFLCGIDHQEPKFLLISVPFLSEAVEVSLCYFFENWLMKHKNHK